MNLSILGLSMLTIFSNQPYNKTLCQQLEFYGNEAYKMVVLCSPLPPPSRDKDIENKEDLSLIIEHLKIDIKYIMKELDKLRKDKR